MIKPHPNFINPPPITNALVKLPSDALIQQLASDGLFDEIEALEKKYQTKLYYTEAEKVERYMQDHRAERFLAQLVTQNEKMLKLKDNIRVLSSTDDPILIHGETGTGKELIAKALHGNRVGQFIALNCAGLPEHLVESELFGHLKGSFTGATADKPGLLSVAGQGTIFLDEIGDLRLDLQSKLLRAVQDMKVRKVGSNTEEDITCRIVCASHHDIKKMALDDKGFRIDLYARLSTFELHTVPLRERYEDVLPILKYLDKDKGEECYMSKVPAETFWNRQTYPLNVRDLQRMVRRYKVLGKIGE